MIYIIISIIVLIISAVIIIFLNKKVKNLSANALYLFSIGVLATFVGFTLSLGATDIFNSRAQKKEIANLLETNLYLNYAESKDILTTINFLEGNHDETSLIIIQNNSLDLFKGYEGKTNLYSDEFKKNIPIIQGEIRTCIENYKPGKNDFFMRNDLKCAIVKKYIYSLYINNELKYIKDEITSNERDKTIQEIKKEDKSLSFIAGSGDINKILPESFVNNCK